MWTEGPSLKSYATTALWASTDNGEGPHGTPDGKDNGGDPLDANYTLEDLADETVARMRDDWEDFRARAGDKLDGLDLEQVAHDFWLTRNGHGAGFWDGDYPEPLGDELTKIAEAFGECNLYVDDAGKVHVS